MVDMDMVDMDMVDTDMVDTDMVDMDMVDMDMDMVDKGTPSTTKTRPSALGMSDPIMDHCN